jgi:hypothetical protein
VGLVSWLLRLGLFAGAAAAVREVMFRRNAQKDPLVDPGRSP